MADNSKIEWTDATWNPTVGCSIISPGCTNCYAMKVAHRFGGSMPWSPVENAKYAGLTKAVNHNPVWTGKVRLVEKALDQPLRWRKPRRIFVNSMSDLFHENLSDEAIYAVLAAMAATFDVSSTDENHVITGYRQRHTYQVLTKRAARQRDLMLAFHEVARGDLNAMLRHPFSRAACWISRNQGHPCWMNAPLSSWQWVMEGCPGLWLGVSVEDQARADERIPDLLATPAAVRFVSCEPLLAAVHLGLGLRRYVDDEAFLARGERNRAALETICNSRALRPKLDWVIAGSESGPGARPCDVEWVRGLRDQCSAAGLPFFWKQHVENGKKVGIPELDGRQWAEFPR